MPTPYTTKSGVQIGSLYTPTARPHHDRDAIRIQSALLGQKPDTDWDGIGIAVACIALLAAIIIAIN